MSSFVFKSQILSTFVLNSILEQTKKSTLTRSRNYRTISRKILTDRKIHLRWITASIFGRKKKTKTKNTTKKTPTKTQTTYVTGYCFTFNSSSMSVYVNLHNGPENARISSIMLFTLTYSTFRVKVLVLIYNYHYPDKLF